MGSAIQHPKGCWLKVSLTNNRNARGGAALLVRAQLTMIHPNIGPVKREGKKVEKQEEVSKNA